MSAPGEFSGERIVCLAVFDLLPELEKLVAHPWVETITEASIETRAADQLLGVGEIFSSVGRHHERQ